MDAPNPPPQPGGAQPHHGAGQPAAAGAGGDGQQQGQQQQQQQPQLPPIQNQIQIVQPRAGRHVKIRDPRVLGSGETQQKLDAWKSQFLLYFGRDETFQKFVQTETTWDRFRLNYGFVAEEDGLERTGGRLKIDLDAFFQLVQSFMPDYHILSKLKATTCINDVWRLVYRIHGAQITPDSFLNITSLKKGSNESYRCFFERLVAHTTDHLVEPHIVIEELTSGPHGDKMNLSMYNMVVALWLQLINPKLPRIIQIEYQKELREGTHVYALLDRICSNIDLFLVKHESDTSVSRVTPQTSQAVDGAGALPGSGHAPAGYSEPGMVDQTRSDHTDNYVRFLSKSGQGKSSRFGKKSGFSSRSARSPGRSFGRDRNSSRRDTRKNQMFCGHCQFLQKVTQRPMDVNHDPDQCRNKQYAVRQLQLSQDMERDLEDLDDSASSEDELEQGEFPTFFESSAQYRLYQINSETRKSSTEVKKAIKKYRQWSHRSPVLSSPTLPVETPAIPVQSPPVVRNLDIPLNKLRKIRSIVAKLSASPLVRKEKSPSVRASYLTHTLTAVLDTGAELSVIDLALVRRLGIPFVPSSVGAQAADQAALKVAGQTENSLQLQIHMDQGPVTIDLGKVVVIENLGTPILIGEPGIKDNKIFIVSYRELIGIDKEGDIFTSQYADSAKTQNDFQVARATSHSTLEPGESIQVRVVRPFLNTPHVILTPRSGIDWAGTSFKVTGDGTYMVRNVSERTVSVRRKDPLMDVRSVVTVELPSAQVDIPEPHHDPPDIIQYSPLKEFHDDHDQHIKEIQVNDDGLLPPEIEMRIHALHRRYKTVFTPRPGKYNGACGIVDNSLDFTQLPAPNGKIHVPNYTPELNEELAKKMDQLLDWGVLMEPEKLGVRVKFCSPSMVVPKTEKGEYRLVTDFSQLNEYLRKSPGISPTMEEAKRAIASKRFRIDLDLSNYFYQSGMSRQIVSILVLTIPRGGCWYIPANLRASKMLRRMRMRSWLVFSARRSERGG